MAISRRASFNHWTEPLWWMTITIPLLFVDVRIAPTLGLLTVAFRYWQFYIHSTARPHLGALRRLLVDNRYHRIHHSLDPSHHDKNFGAMTPLWDWLFGTIHMPAKDEWPAVGLVEVGEPKDLSEWSSLPWRLGNGVSLSGWAAVKSYLRYSGKPALFDAHSAVSPGLIPVKAFAGGSPEKLELEVPVPPSVSSTEPEIVRISTFAAPTYPAPFEPVIPSLQ
jgi:hypothetical protein